MLFGWLKFGLNHGFGWKVVTRAQFRWTKTLFARSLKWGVSGHGFWMNSPFTLIFGMEFRRDSRTETIRSLNDRPQMMSWCEKCRPRAWHDAACSCSAHHDMTWHVQPPTCSTAMFPRLVHCSSLCKCSSHSSVLRSGLRSWHASKRLNIRIWTALSTARVILRASGFESFASAWR